VALAFASAVSHLDDGAGHQISGKVVPPRLPIRGRGSYFKDQNGYSEEKRSVGADYRSDSLAALRSFDHQNDSFIEKPVTQTQKPKTNTRLIGSIVLVAAGMFGFGFALVPLYNVFCDITGLNGKVKTEAVAETDYEVDEAREMTIEFITTLNENMPLAFRAEKTKMKIHPGQYYTVKFYAENLTDHKMIGRAIPSIAPGWATQYLKKSECFCFSEQAFEPHKLRELPVRFVIDPSVPDNVKDITLSYTFFDITDKKQN
jgi:cytochrome c oxidase assembly protein subunit 11